MGQDTSRLDTLDENNLLDSQHSLEKRLFGAVIANDAVLVGSIAADQSVIELMSRPIKQEMNRSLAHLAVRSGASDTLRVICRVGACVTLCDAVSSTVQKLESASTKAGNTPVHYAATKDDLDCLRVLIEAGADLNIPNNDGQTPLHSAASHTRVEAMAHLLLGGGWFHHSVVGNRADAGYVDALVKILGSSGSELTVRTRAAFREHWDSPIRLGYVLVAVLKGLRHTVRHAPVSRRRLLLIRFKAGARAGSELRVAFRSAEEGRPLELRARLSQGRQAGAMFATGQVEVPKGKVGAGDVVEGVTCMMVAAARGHVCCVKELLDAGWGPSRARCDERGNTAVWWAKDASIRALLLGKAGAEQQEVSLIWARAEAAAELVAARRLKSESFAKVLAVEPTLAPHLNRELFKMRELEYHIAKLLQLVTKHHTYVQHCVDTQNERVREAYSQQDDVAADARRASVTLHQDLYTATHRSNALITALRQDSKITSSADGGDGADGTAQQATAAQGEVEQQDKRSSGKADEPSDVADKIVSLEDRIAAVEAARSVQGISSDPIPALAQIMIDEASGSAARLEMDAIQGHIGELWQSQRVRVMQAVTGCDSAADWLREHVVMLRKDILERAAGIATAATQLPTDLTGDGPSIAQHELDQINARMVARVTDNREYAGVDGGQ